MALDPVVQAAVNAAIEGEFTAAQDATVTAVVKLINNLANDLEQIPLDMITPDFLKGMRTAATLVSMAQTFVNGDLWV